jgi:hypothetical protein
VSARHVSRDATTLLKQLSIREKIRAAQSGNQAASAALCDPLSEKKESTMASVAILNTK